MRLGAGSEDSENGLEALKAHKFFKGIDFNKLHQQKSPLIITTIKCSASNNSLLSSKSNNTPNERATT